MTLSLAFYEGRDRVSLRWQQWQYPLHYRDSLLQEARRTRLSPSLLAAVIREESRFQPGARSEVGACGLMQLMPETAQWVDQHLEGNEAQELDLSDPQVNVKLGATYLEYLQQSFQGNEVAFLAAYNAGPGQTLEWQAGARNGRLQLDDIAFPETRAYVEAVLESERIYRQLYPSLKQGLNERGTYE